MTQCVLCKETITDTTMYDKVHTRNYYVHPVCYLEYTTRCTREEKEKEVARRARRIRRFFRICKFLFQ